MFGEEASQWNWRSLIKENTHRPLGRSETCLGEFQDSECLLTGNTWKPFKELIDRRAIFQVFE